eukprot:TRINITY_DN7928_c0_g1_i1.p1 TRINITY_DN7928_c0_g1~~TRINITY_DN7928_c0_g1_i1.p1  ORF type:complete len:517 (+),score=124.39 TRINITY_DN7928_c0_g1_i1:73-1623(+)
MSMIRAVIETGLHLQHQAVKVRFSSYFLGRQLQLDAYKTKFGPLYQPTSAGHDKLHHLRAKAESASPGERFEDELQRGCGRVVSKRSSGSKLHFYDIAADRTRLQVMASLANCSNPDDYPLLHDTIKRGDIVEVEGYVGRSKRGEPTLFSKDIKLLAPCMHDLPEQLKDKETQVRKRHVHMLTNPELAATLRLRHTVTQTIRAYLCQHDFVEVETPILAPQAGGAAARPFVTHHNALDADLSLRIAPELYLKRLVVGGLDRVFEIGKVFRNEGVDHSHNPEFTTCEFYMAYGRFEQLLDMTQDLLRRIAQAARAADWSDVDRLGLDDPFDVVSYIDVLSQHLAPATMAQLRTDPDAAVPALRQACQDAGVDVTGVATAAALVDKLGGVLIEDKIERPTFVIEHPVLLSPLAAEHSTKAGAAARMELFVDGLEVCNAYQELTDPNVQRARFQAQLADRSQGDDEAPVPDEDYCQALMYGLPPTIGWGMGIDRLVMLLSNQAHIRDVISFPMSGQTQE